MPNKKYYNFPYNIIKDIIILIMKSLAVSRALTKIGADLRDARRRRRITMALMAERLSITRVTLRKLENGDPSVSLGTFMLALHAFEMLDQVTALTDRSQDKHGLDLDAERLPQRVRTPRRSAS